MCLYGSEGKAPSETPATLPFSCEAAELEYQSAKSARRVSHTGQPMVMDTKRERGVCLRSRRSKDWEASEVRGSRAKSVSGPSRRRTS